MGESVIGRPIGPSYVPGTSQGQSSANNPMQSATAAKAIQNPLMPAPAQQQSEVPNPAQNPRQKWWNQANAMLGKNPGVIGAVKAPGTIGAQQSSGSRRFSQ